MSYQITLKEKGTIVECSGTLSIQEINEANGLLHGHARFDEHTYQIWNYENADLSQITEDEMVEPAATDWAATISVPKMKVALVVRDDHAVKLCEHYIERSKEYTSKWECQLFDSMDDALEWVES